MKIEIIPGAARGAVTAPPSKSEAHRALICGALTNGSTLHGVSDSDDVTATLRCLETLGTSVEKDGGTVYIGGLDPKEIKECTLNCGESGSTLRFLLPLCLISGERVTLTGTEKLLSRPLDEYEELCKRRAFLFEKGENSVTVAGALTPGEYDVSMSKSSQFMTGLLISLGSLDGRSVLRVLGRAESASYVDITLDVMRKFGVGASASDEGYITSGGGYERAEYTVGGDWSNAAFTDALNVLGGDVKVAGLDATSRQGDRVYPATFEKIIRGETVNLSDCPDLAPLLFALAAYRGGGRFTGTGRLKYKESDRAEAMKEELSAFGVTLGVGEDSVTVSGELKRPDRALSSHNDHRIAMALSVLLTVTGGELDGAEAVRKSYPEFYEILRSLGIEVKIVDAR